MSAHNTVPSFFKKLQSTVASTLVGYFVTGGRYYDSPALFVAERTVLGLTEEERQILVSGVRSRLEQAYIEKDQQTMEVCYVLLTWIMGQFQFKQETSTPKKHLRALQVLTTALTWSMEHVTRAIGKAEYSPGGFDVSPDATMVAGRKFYTFGPDVACNACGEFGDVNTRHEYIMCTCDMRMYCADNKCQSEDYDHGHKFVCGKQPQFWADSFSMGVYSMEEKGFPSGWRKKYGDVQIQVDANKRFAECMALYFETGGVSLELGLLVACYEWYWGMNTAKFKDYSRVQKKLIADAYHRRDWVTLNQVFPYYTWVYLMRCSGPRLKSVNERSRGCIIAFHLSLLCSMEAVYNSIIHWGLCEPIDFTVETIEGDVCMAEPKEGFILCDGCGQLGDRYTDDGKEEEVKTGELHCVYYCSGCKLAKYCSHECQRAAWKDGGHKKCCGRQPAWWRDAFLDGFYVKQHRLYKSKNSIA